MIVVMFVGTVMKMMMMMMMMMTMTMTMMIDCGDDDDDLIIADNMIYDRRVTETMYR